MKIKNIKHVSGKILEGIEFDLSIISSGYESRATNLIQQVRIRTKSKYCFTFHNFEKNLSRKKNDRTIRDAGYRTVLFSGEESSATFDWFNKFLQETEEDELAILIDISCMTRLWYASIIDCLRNYEDHNISRITLYFSYSPAIFSPAPKASARNSFVGPIKGFNNILPANFPTALIIGLGYIPERAYGLKEYLDAIPFIFYTDNSRNNQYSGEVLENNQQLIAETNQRNIYTYPIDDIEATYYSLLDLCRDLQQNHRLILAPCGPKPFTLACLLTSVKLGGVDVWRISAGENQKPTDKVASGDVIVASVLWESNSPSQFRL